VSTTARRPMAAAVGTSYAKPEQGTSPGGCGERPLQTGPGSQNATMDTPAPRESDEPGRRGGGGDRSVPPKEVIRASEAGEDGEDGTIMETGDGQRRPSGCDEAGKTLPAARKEGRRIACSDPIGHEDCPPGGKKKDRDQLVKESRRSPSRPP